MRKVLTVALVALLLFAGTGVLAIAASDTAESTVDLEEGKIKPGHNGSSDPFHDGGPAEQENPISVGP